MHVKEKIENFMRKPYYLMIVFAVFYLIWSLKFFVDQSVLLQTTFMIYIPVALIFALILIFYEDTVHTIPFLLGFVFSIGYNGLNLDTLNQLTYAFIALGIIGIGMLIHLVKYPFKLKITPIMLTFILAAISFYIPLIYTPFSIEALMVSSHGLIYVFLYGFYSSTMKTKDLDYMMKIILFTLMMLSLQLLSAIIKSVLSFEGNLVERILMMMKNELSIEIGWGNINDIVILIVFMLFSLLYFILKYPKKISFFIGFLIVSTLVYFSFARASMISLTVVIVSFFIYILKTKNKLIAKHFLYALIVMAILVVININLVGKIIQMALDSIKDGQENGFMNTRIQLWDMAVQAFKQYPRFGSGWMTPQNILAPWENRLTVYHSTFFHVLATGGIFGIIILVYHYIIVFKTMFKIKDKQILFPLVLIYIVTQVHGLIDNVQYMIYFTLVFSVIFIFIEKNQIDDDLIEVNTETII